MADKTDFSCEEAPERCPRQRRCQNIGFTPNAIGQSELLYHLLQGRDSVSHLVIQPEVDNPASLEVDLQAANGGQYLLAARHWTIGQMDRIRLIKQRILFKGPESIFEKKYSGNIEGVSLTTFFRRVVLASFRSHSPKSLAWCLRCRFSDIALFAPRHLMEWGALLAFLSGTTHASESVRQQQRNHCGREW